MTRQLVTGWGLTAPTAAEVARPASADELRAAVRCAGSHDRGLVARGLGRSYGDAAQNAGGLVVDATGVAGVSAIDPIARTATMLGGTSLDAALRELVPLGFFVPVTPGTSHVTVGGAIASDIHGKNHHVEGSWCDHVTSMTLALPGGDVVTVGPDRDPDLFWATAGGMGLTGVVVDATVRLLPIETSTLAVDIERAADLDEAMTLMVTGDHRYHFSVAWIDLLARGAAMGRSVLTRGRFATLGELAPRRRRDPLTFAPRVLAAAPPGAAVPPHLLNPLTVRAFNEFWFRKAPRRAVRRMQSINAYFYPLDAVGGWNRLYGRAGFLQWQVVVPNGAEDTLRSLVEQLSASGDGSFLAVLKRFGAGNAGHLSFPREGWTLALDLPGGHPADGPLLDKLDEEVVAAGGRVYLAKDSRMRPDLLADMYPRLDEWREVQARADPHGRLQSDLSRRLRLVNR
jgi:decaprenylphospho-beta-D-ribofuranose 2-oxidase